MKETLRAATDNPAFAHRVTQLNEQLFDHGADSPGAICVSRLAANRLDAGRHRSLSGTGNAAQTACQITLTSSPSASA